MALPRIYQPLTKLVDVMFVTDANEPHTLGEPLFNMPCLTDMWGQPFKPICDSSLGLVD